MKTETRSNPGPRLNALLTRSESREKKEEDTNMKKSELKAELKRVEAEMAAKAKPFDVTIAKLQEQLDVTIAKLQEQLDAVRKHKANVMSPIEDKASKLIEAIEHIDDSEKEAARIAAIKTVDTGVVNDNETAAQWFKKNEKLQWVRDYRSDWEGIKAAAAKPAPHVFAVNNNTDWASGSVVGYVVVDEKGKPWATLTAIKARHRGDCPTYAFHVKVGGIWRKSREDSFWHRNIFGRSETPLKSFIALTLTKALMLKTAKEWKKASSK